MRLDNFGYGYKWYTFRLKNGNFFMVINGSHKLVDWSIVDANICKNVKNCVAMYINLIENK